MKVHLLDSDEPLREGVTLFALCGKEIRNAGFVFMFDDDATTFRESLNSLNTCAHCLEIEIEKHFVYGIVEGQSAYENTHA